MRAKHEEDLYNKFSKIDDYMSDIPVSIDSTLLDLVSAWSQTAFGPGLRTESVLQHITKELNEIRQDPDDLEEWIDVILLAINGASRTGAGGKEIISMLKRKIRKNCVRKWPDWRDVDPDQPIEHIK